MNELFLSGTILTLVKTPTVNVNEYLSQVGTNI